MNNTLKRGISGIIYILIMWIGTSYSQESFHILFVILGMICLYEMWKLRKGRLVCTISGVIPYLYIIIPFILVHFIETGFMLFLFILVWIFDTFAYIIGSVFENKQLGILRKHKILPSISPKKSWEGFFGGMLFVWCAFFSMHLILALFVGWLHYPDFDGIEKGDVDLEFLGILGFHKFYNITLYLIPLIISITATTGDFIASYYKRIANVKDYGNIIPGHGGMIDRMDSFLITIPILYILESIYIK